MVMVDYAALEARAAQATSGLDKLWTPKGMEIAVLSAAIQEPGMQKKDFFDDPREAAFLATFTWIEIARKMGRSVGRAVGLQLAAALDPTNDYIPQKDLLDPVAAHFPGLTFRDGTGQDLSDEDARHILRACGSDVKIHNLGAFLNLLEGDDTIRNQIHEHTLRVARGASKLGCTSITGFIGMHKDLSYSDNLAMFEKEVIPLFKKLQEMGMVFHVEPCPMPGWDKSDRFVKNIACTPEWWMGMFRICEKHGVGDVFRITYDESHSILMGSTHHEAFSILRAAQLEFLIDEFHSKSQRVDEALKALATYHGRATPFLNVDENPGNAWGRMITGPTTHPLPGLEAWDLKGMAEGKTPDWLGHQLDARQILKLDPRKRDPKRRGLIILEHEFGPLRKQNIDLVVGGLVRSLTFLRHVDEAADAIVSGQAYLRANGIAVPGAVRPTWQNPRYREVAKQFAVPLPKLEEAA